MKLDFAINIVSAIWLLSEIILAVMKRAATTEHDQSSLRLLWFVIIASVGLGVFMRMKGMGVIHSGDVLSVIGLIVILLGLIIRWAAIFTLRKFFTVDVAIAADHRVVNTGLYKFVRHPSYTGSLLSFLGLGLTLSSWLSIVVIVIPITFAFMYRITIEEKALVQYLGADYTRYASETNRLLPGIY